MIVRIRVLLRGRDSFHMIGQCERTLRIAVAAKCNDDDPLSAGAPWTCELRLE